ncbi:hypothetical protein A9Q84_10115 [Halobacteriovorax marinus]|uniref:ABC transporter domain-containing protein n=1 Tax=Halobacteriovorax marinus TaxID=97084 RepID=A0A1Y5F711_9BACT|nr:hypothetical protein A9Q84_10115 [Halobacteriovorax marinus]
MPILKCHSLSKSFSEKNLFSNISFEIRPGERLSIMGENGVGKTTLLKVLASQLLSDSGSLHLNGLDYSNLKFHEIKKSIAWVNSEDHGLYPKLTGLDNIQYFAKLLKISNSELNEKMKPWQDIGLFNKALNEKFSLCSIGMKKILLIFCLTMHVPQIVIMDEPFKSFDQENKLKIIKLMSDLFQEGVIIYSTHDESLNAHFDAKVLKLVGEAHVS